MPALAASGKTDTEIGVCVIVAVVAIGGRVLPEALLT